MDILFIFSVIIGIVLITLSIIGCFLPVLPGPPLAYLSLLIIKFAAPNSFSNKFLVILGIVTVVVYLFDYLLPLVGAKLYNASRSSIWLSIFGMIIGAIFFPPFGIFIGLLIGTITGELISGKAKAEAVKIGLISFGFSLFSILLKVSFVCLIAYYFLESIYKYFL